MRTMPLGPTQLQVPVVAVGCMRMDAVPLNDAERFVQTALDEGANFFDHADVYGDAIASETVFAKAVHMSSSVRDRILIQSKCGLADNMYDFSKEHILQAVDGSLKRLNTDYLDVLLLHRPDALVEPEEVASAFDALEQAGKVRYFGVSNHKPMQIELLKKFVRQPIVANQLQLSITNATMIGQGLNVNMENAFAVDRDGSVLDYCRIHDITIQPWSPFQYGFFDGVFLGNDSYAELNRVIDEVAAHHRVSNTTIAIAWILRHPAHMQPIIGTMNRQRLLDCLKASEVELSRQEWYAILQAAGTPLP
ncbi:MAG: aldo/keto reductase [Sulfobacillus acidophilus]|uniref:Aldo/keto reductase n=1 Tax=Sulfobacillus acidophilus TaxID=53633 RepID=A0A2T2WK15_9FIRM|nr:MAG: aldo/keto reductase [Sulfobacillus acidophilus]